MSVNLSIAILVIFASVFGGIALVMELRRYYREAIIRFAWPALVSAVAALALVMWEYRYVSIAVAAVLAVLAGMLFGFLLYGPGAGYRLSQAALITCVVGAPFSLLAWIYEIGTGSDFWRRHTFGAAWPVTYPLWMVCWLILLVGPFLYARYDLLYSGPDRRLRKLHR